MIGIGLLLVALLSGGLFLIFSPQFGATKAAKRTKQILASPNYQHGEFHNLEKTRTMTDFRWSSLGAYFTNEGKVAAPQAVPVQKLPPAYFNQLKNHQCRITWLGHSTLLIEMAGKKMLLDPMLGAVPSPIPALGSKRFNPELPIAADSLPKLDYVLISHDHYDHMDYETIQKIKDRTAHFLVPLGVDAHLKSWGVDADKIIAFDWGHSLKMESLNFTATPARHFSGRGLTDRNSTLWCSWVIQSGDHRLFFSGDSGYGAHFKQIGEQYGPFDLCMLECGQYDAQWAHIHMMPEEVAQAQLDLRGRVLLPIHWGAFKLGLHSWRDPIERLSQRARELKLELTTPQIGQAVLLDQIQLFNAWYAQDAISAVPATSGLYAN